MQNGQNEKVGLIGPFSSLGCFIRGWGYIIYENFSWEPCKMNVVAVNLFVLTILYGDQSWLILLHVPELLTKKIGNSYSVNYILKPDEMVRKVLCQINRLF